MFEATSSSHTWNFLEKEEWRESALFEVDYFKKRLKLEKFIMFYY